MLDGSSAVMARKVNGKGGKYSTGSVIEKFHSSLIEKIKCIHWD